MVYLLNDSSACPYPNNLFTNDLRGFVAGYGSTIFAGSYWDMMGMYNSDHDNTYLDVGCYEYSYIEAEYNYWGFEPSSDQDETSYIAEFDDCLSTDPWAVKA